jgi:hypothetical protein
VDVVVDGIHLSQLVDLSATERLQGMEKIERGSPCIYSPFFSFKREKSIYYIHYGF